MLGSNRRSHAHSQEEAVPMPDSAAIPVAAAVPVAAPARQGGGRSVPLFSFTLLSQYSVTFID